MSTRIGMMLPGAVSLGAYEGGALAAVLKAVQASEGQLVIDAIASASAGSMTGLIASRALLTGADPIELMVQTWVVLPQLDHLETHDLSAPLTMANLISTATELLGGVTVPDGPPAIRQREPVRLSMALTALGGLTYAMSHLRDPKDPDSSQVLLATTYVDFVTAELEPGARPADFQAVRDAAMASGSTPIGFPPRFLDRSADEAEYRRQGVLCPADRPFGLWYSDGGDIDNQPFGRLLDLIAQIDEQEGDERVLLALNIEPAPAPAWSGTWFDQSSTPSWFTTLLHVDHIRSTQSLYEDLRRLEKTNQQIEWLSSVADSLQASNVLGTAHLPRAVAESAQRIAGDQGHIRKVIREAADSEPPQDVAPATNLKDLLFQAAGLADKRKVVVELISPQVDLDPAHRLTADQQLSGEFLFHFGGFFDQRYRESDFALGYRNARAWLDWWLDDRVTDPAGVLRSVDEAYDSITWRNEAHGDASVKSLSFKQKVEGLHLLGHVGRVVIHDLRADIAHE